MSRIAIKHSKYYNVAFCSIVSIFCIVSNGCHYSYPTSGDIEIEPWPIGSGQSTSSLSLVVSQETSFGNKKEKKEGLGLVGDLQEITVRAFEKSGRFSTIKIGKLDSVFLFQQTIKYIQRKTVLVLL